MLTIQGLPEVTGNFAFRLTVFSNDLYQEFLQQPEIQCVAYQDERNFELLIEPATP